MIKKTTLLPENFSAVLTEIIRLCNFATTRDIMQIKIKI